MKGKIEQEMKALLKEDVLAGMALRVRKAGKVVFEECMGYADRENRIPVQTDTMYRYCSMSKLIIAVGIMQLQEKKLLSLDDSLLRYFLHYPEEKRSITIRHLLNHSCGMGQGDIGNAFIAENMHLSDTLKERTDRWADMPLDYPVGTSPFYSGFAAFDLAARIIEIVSGQELMEYLTAHLFVPLGMKDTCFQLSEQQKERMAALYIGVNGKLERIEEHFDEIDGKEGYCSGAAGLYGTLDDYDRLTQMFYQGGQWNGIRILEEETIQLMATPRQITETESVPGCPWGLGFMVFEKPQLTDRGLGAGTFGWSGAYGTHMYIDPKNDLCMTLMAGRADINGADSIASKRIEKAIFEEFDCVR